MREVEKSSVIVDQRAAADAAAAVAASFWHSRLLRAHADTSDFASHIVTDVISWTAAVSLCSTLFIPFARGLGQSRRTGILDCCGMDSAWSQDGPSAVANCHCRMPGQHKKPDHSQYRGLTHLLRSDKMGDQL